MAGSHVGVHGEVSDLLTSFGAFVDNGEVEGDWHVSF